MGKEQKKQQKQYEEWATAAGEEAVTGKGVKVGEGVAGRGEEIEGVRFCSRAIVRCSL